MSAIPANLARVSNLLASRIALGGISGTNRELLRTQVQLSTGERFSRPSEDSVGASAVLSLNDSIGRREQRVRNLSAAESMLDSIDSSLNDITELMQEAKTIGLAQVGFGSDEVTRRNQAGVIDSMLNALVSMANRDRNGVYLFGGERASQPPFGSLLQGIRYTGSGLGQQSDIGMSADVRVTMGGEQAFGAISNRVRGDRDLDPSMTANTRLSALNGANGLGVRPGSIEIDVNGTVTQLDLSEADSIGDILGQLSQVIQATDPGATVGIDPVTGDRIAITPSAGVTIEIRDSNSTSTAGDLGLLGTYPPAVSTTGADLDPRIAPLTRLDSITGLTQPMGEILVRNGNQSRIIDVGALVTVEDLQNAVAAGRIGARVVISDDGTRLHVVNELSGSALAVEEFSGNPTASELGIRSFASTTQLADFNEGRGVRQVSGAVDPLTGLPDPARNMDFRVTLKDGRAFDVDIEGDATVQDVIGSINAAATAAGILPAEFNAQLVAVGNGLELVDSTIGGGSTAVAELNASGTAEDLGIFGSSAGASLVGTDRARVVVDSVFSHLIALRDALLANDERGIALAAEKFDGDLTRLSEARADVGVRTQRVIDATSRESELDIMDQRLRSEINDLDYAEAATRFAALQRQLEASLAVSARTANLTLLDFLR
jgi:flagellar hook-associated protein 3 FlgL